MLPMFVTRYHQRRAWLHLRHRSESELLCPEDRRVNMPHNKLKNEEIKAGNINWYCELIHNRPVETKRQLGVIHEHSLAFGTTCSLIEMAIEHDGRFRYKMFFGIALTCGKIELLRKVWFIGEPLNGLSVTRMHLLKIKNDCCCPGKLSNGYYPMDTIHLRLTYRIPICNDGCYALNEKLWVLPATSYTITTWWYRIIRFECSFPQKTPNGSFDLP